MATEYKLLSEVLGNEIYNHYMISSEARFYKWVDGEWIERKAGKHQDGYRIFGTYIDGKCKNFTAHKLVGLAFVPNPQNKPHLDHIVPVNDGGSDLPENLRWVSHQENCENIDWQKKNETREKFGNFGSSSSPVVQFDLDGNLLGEFESIRAAMDATGVFRSGISKTCIGTQKTAGGFIWKYKTQVDTEFAVDLHLPKGDK